MGWGLLSPNGVSDWVRWRRSSGSSEPAAAMWLVNFGECSGSPDLFKGQGGPFYCLLSDAVPAPGLPAMGLCLADHASPSLPLAPAQGRPISPTEGLSEALLSRRLSSGSGSVCGPSRAGALDPAAAAAHRRLKPHPKGKRRPRRTEGRILRLEKKNGRRARRTGERRPCERRRRRPPSARRAAAAGPGHRRAEEGRPGWLAPRLPVEG